jgi:hypothetical protein
MYYKKFICEELAVDMDVASIIFDKMCIGGFRFGSSSKETIIEEANFIKTHCI